MRGRRWLAGWLVLSTLLAGCGHAAARKANRSGSNATAQLAVAKDQVAIANAAGTNNYEAMIHGTRTLIAALHHPGFSFSKTFRAEQIEMALTTVTPAGCSECEVLLTAALPRGR